MRRLPLLCVVATVSVGALPAEAAKKKRANKRGRYPAITVKHLNFRRGIELKLYNEKGLVQKPQIKKLENLLRCHHTKRKHRLHWRLVALLYKVGRHFGRTIEVVSGYRAPKIARKKGVPKSNHTRGRAVDFRIAGVSNEAVRDYLQGQKNVGVGFYPNSRFVHMDVRDHKAYWVDYSGPGQKARYTKQSTAEATAASTAASRKPSPHSRISTMRRPTGAAHRGPFGI